MPRYRFASDVEAQIADLQGVILQPGQEFDPTEFGVPDWQPEPNPHPLFALVVTSPAAALTKPAPAPAQPEE